MIKVNVMPVMGPLGWITAAVGVGLTFGGVGLMVLGAVMIVVAAI